MTSKYEIIKEKLYDGVRLEKVEVEVILDVLTDDEKLELIQDSILIEFENKNLTLSYIQNTVLLAHWMRIDQNIYVDLYLKLKKGYVELKKEQGSVQTVLNESKLSSVEVGIQSMSNLITANLYANQVVFRASQGHGYAAEKANHIVDKLKGHQAVVDLPLIKDGPDRIVNGVNIQTKYCASGAESISSCFKDGMLKYVNIDGSPMKIEVPSDQYQEAVRSMEQRIRNGQVPGITDPQDAKSIVKKGQFTYKQAKNIANFGKIESISYDAINGVKVAGTSFGLSAALTFACSVWNGEDFDVALERAFYSGIKVGGVAWVTSILTAQIGRTGVEQALRPATDFIVNRLGSQTTATLANALRIGKQPIYGAAAANNLSKVIRGNIVTNVLTTTVLSISDINRLIKGQISGGQAFKNITTIAVSVAGGAAGASGGAVVGGVIGSVIPVVGTIAGSVVGGLVGGITSSVVSEKAARSTLDHFIEDDAKEMLSIFEKEFQTLTFDYLLTATDIETVSSKLEDEDMPRLLRLMYSTEHRKELAHDTLEKIIVGIIMGRKKVSIPSDEEMLVLIDQKINLAYNE